MPRLSRRALRAWAAGLHGGQLVILWLVGALVGYGALAGAEAAGTAAQDRAEESGRWARYRVERAATVRDQLANLPDEIGPMYAAYLRDQASRLYADLRTAGLSPGLAQDSLRRVMAWGPAVRAAPDDTAAVDSVAALRVRAKARADSALAGLIDAMIREPRTRRWVTTGMVAALVVAAAILGLLLLVTWDWLGGRARPRSEAGGTDA